MKNQLMFVIVALAVCVISFCSTPDERSAGSSAPGREADVRAVRDALDKYVRLYNAGQYDTIISVLYTDDAVLMAPNTPIRVGRERILAAYLTNAEMNNEHIDSSVVEDIRVSGDLAVARGSDVGTTTPKRRGSPEKYSLNWLMVLERQGDGAWKFICEMWNENAETRERTE